MGKTTKSTIKVLKNTLTKNWRLKIEAVTKMDDYFTICQYKTLGLKDIEIPVPISLEVLLTWCETGMFSLDSKLLSSKLIIKITGLKM